MDMQESNIKGNEDLFNPGFELSKNLENIRLKQKKSKAKFAESLELSPSYYSSLISGKVNPTLKAVAKLSKKLNVDFSFLLLSSTTQEVIDKQKQSTFQLMKDTFAEIYKLEQEKKELERLLETKKIEAYDFQN